MGCAASRLEDEEAVKMCRDRRDFIKQALEQRNRFASSHFAYLESLRRVSMALQRFVAGDDHHELISDSFISPLKQQKPEMLGLPYGSYEKRTIHVSKYLRSGPNPSVSVEEQPRPVETIRIESHYPMDNYGGMDRFFAAQSSPMRPSSYYTPYDRPNYPPPSPQEPVRNSYYMPYDRPSYPPASPQEPTRTSYYTSYDRPSYPPPSPQEQESSQWDFFWNPFSSLDNFAYPRPRSSYDNVVTDDELARLQRTEGNAKQETKGFESKGVQCAEVREPRNKVELEIKAHKKELVRNKVANAEETPGFTVYLNRRPASLVEAMKDIDSQFLGICDSAKEISVMLEASRAQYSTSNDLSAKMLNPVALLRSASSRSSSSRFLLAPTSSIEDLYDNETSSCYSEESCSTMSGSHHSTLDRLYTWEKKLYKEVKAGERLRIDYEKRLNHLRNQDVKGDEPSSVDKTRAAMRSLHTRMKVSIHTVQSISGRIEVLRDEELQPQLMELIQGLSRMWRAMAERHKAQKRTIDDAKLLFLQRHPTAATAIALSAPDAATPPPAAVALDVMATESAVRLIGGTGAGNWTKDFGAFDSSLGNLSGEGLGFVDNNSGVYGGWRESVPNRSGSAPPSMEGSLAALGHMIGQQSGNLEASLGGKLGKLEDSSKSEEQLRADPAYCDYYGSKVNLNPRLPPPLISRESRRFMNRVGKVKEWRVVSQDDSSKSSLFIPRSTLSTHREEPEDDRSPRLDSSSAEDAQVSGKSGSNFDSHSTNIGEFASENFQQNAASLFDSSSHPSNSNTGDGISDHSDINSSTDFSLDAVKTSGLNPWTPITATSTVRSTLSNPISSTSVPSSSSPDSNTSMQTSQQEKPSIDIKLGNDVLGSGSVMTELDTVNSNMKNLRISLDSHDTMHVKQQWQDSVMQQYGPSPLVQGDPIQMIPQGTHLPHIPFVDNLSHTQLKLPTGDMQQFLPLPGIPPFYAPNSFGSPYYQNLHPASVLPTPFGTAGYASGLPPVMNSYATQGSVPTPVDSPITPSFSGRPSGFPSAGNLSAGTEFLQPYKMYGQQIGVSMQPSIPDPNFFQFFQHPSLLPYAGINQYNTVGPRVNVVGNPADSFDPPKVLPQPTYPSDQRIQLPRTGVYNSPAARRGGSAPNYQCMSQYVGAPMSYPTSPVFQGQPFNGIFSPGRRNDTVRFQTPPRNMTVNSGIQGQREREKFDDSKACSFLEELKSNRARRVELSDIAGRIVEYSADQHGSRFIQQKLENCTAEEKASVFAEVLPHASSLMTDVFGNYVIQKFFEHGTPEQRRDLATKLVGHVLALSLQMYGCRVIQKALEVMELDQKIDLVRELDGNIMRCVRDQNGNHVIQKCIECVPTEHIGFVISAFRGQVGSLSMHPYGCRVIQRVLEHCGGDSQGQCIIDEILQSACVLAQDQYGNYVTQHVLERGKGHERAQIISKLAGQVVTMSQNKFASNVIEKCFQHGDIAERDLLIREIVEQTEGNDNLLAMMKDQYANYVVQKILETCNEQQRELLLSRVKGHLQALRKYTYGKHIVSRVEQLCGEGDTESDS
ncbi:hypothetical protein E2562_001758 [Oryza meyeriana var. granulata]|uniref:PUM-HD domain-containing protein n=1 Tax=Oryza meyeriana var. granulata TaxID=110450 RepID=A0A6G1CDJ9_9ORYZ|nr:hypothetical protein E2562_001758 [Oryza meyeriana var. granulata]